MKSLFSVIILIWITTLIGCKTHEKMNAQKLIIELEKTACGGACPIYTIQIFDKGLVTLDARENLKMIGKFKSQITFTELESFVNEFEQIDFFNLENRYNSLMMDLPTKYISYTKNDITKKITAYDKIPKNLTALIQQIDALINSLVWTEIE